jgi:hypothetical protein
MIAFLLIWSIGIYILWLRSTMIMKTRGRKEVAGAHKAVLELADAMRTHLLDDGVQGDGLSTLTETKLRRRITKDLRGGSISYATPLLANTKERYNGTEHGFKPLVKSYKWSIATFFMSLVLMILGIYTAFGSFFYPVPIEWAISIYLGTSRVSRVTLFFWSFVLVGILSYVLFTFALV